MAILGLVRMTPRALLPLGGLLLALTPGPALAQEGGVPALTREGVAAIEAGELERALQLFHRCLELAPEDPTSAYNLACVHALLGEADEAFAWVGVSLDWGFANAPLLHSDSDLAGLHTDPRWLALHERFVALLPTDPDRTLGLARAHLARDDGAGALPWLERTLELGRGLGIEWLHAEPRLQALRATPRFAALLEGALAWNYEQWDSARRDLERARRTADGLLLEWQDGHSYSLRGLLFSPDDRDVLTWAVDGRLLLWDAARGDALGGLGLYSGNLLVRTSRDGRRVLVIDMATRELSLWDPRTQERLAIEGLEGAYVLNAAFDPAGSDFVVVDMIGRLYRRDRDGRGPAEPLARVVPSEGLEWSPEGPGGTLLSQGVRRVELVDATTGALLWHEGAGDGNRVFARLSADGRRVVLHRGFRQWATPEVSVAGAGEVEVRELARPSEPLLTRPTTVPPQCPWVPMITGTCVDDRGTILATQERDEEGSVCFRVWDVDGRRLLLEYGAAGTPQVRLAVSGDGQRVGTVELEDLGPGLLARETAKLGLLAPYSGEVLVDEFGTVDTPSATGFSPDGGVWTVAANKVRSELLLRDAETGAPPDTTTAAYGLTFPGTIYTGAFSRDGSRVALGAYPSLARIVDLREAPPGAWRAGDGWAGAGGAPLEGGPGSTLLVAHAQRATDVVAGPAGGSSVLCLTAGNDLGDGQARPWNVRTGRLAAPLPGGQGPFTAGAPTADGAALLTVGWRDVELRPTDGRPLEWVAGGAWQDCAVSEDGETILLTASGRGVIGHLRRDHDEGWTPVGTYPLFVWGRNTDNPRARLGQRGTVFAMVPAVGPETPQGSVLVRDAVSGEVLQVVRPADQVNPIRDLAFSPDGRWLATFSTGWTRLHEFTGEWEERPERALPNIGAFCGAFSADSQRFAAGGGDGRVHLASVGSGEHVVLEGHSDLVRHVAFGPGDETLVTCSHDGTARLWDAASGALLHVLEGHTATVAYAEFVGTDRLVTQGWDSTFRLWDTGSGALLLTLVLYDDDNWLVFRPDGYYDGTPQAAEWARIRRAPGEELVPLSSYAARLHRPERIEAAAGGEVASSRPRLPAAPELRVFEPRDEDLAARDFALVVEAEGVDDVATVRVEQDGVPVDVPADALRPRGRRGGREKLELALELAIPADRSETTITLRAESATGVLGRPEPLRLRYTKLERNLFVVAVGIEAYEAPGLRLQAVRNDVTALVERLRREEGRTFDRVEVTTLLDDEVRDGALRRKLVKLVNETTPRDTVIVFAAGHGARSSLGDYYLLQTDTPADAPEYGIARSDLDALVTDNRIQAERKLLLIDTCHAGLGRPGERGVAVGGGSAFDEEERAELARRARGLYVFAASSSDQAAIERDGHGLFTQALLDALDGAADGNGDGAVDVQELIAHVTRQVQAESGGEQTPTTPRVETGEPFPLATVGR